MTGAPKTNNIMGLLQRPVSNLGITKTIFVCVFGRDEDQTCG